MYCNRLLALLALALPAFTAPAPAAPAQVQPDGVQCKTGNTSPPPSASGRLIKIDGKTQYFSGTNAWWLGHLFYQSDIDQAFSQISAAGIKVVRIWAFGNTNNAATETNIFYQTLNSSGAYINYDVNKGIGRLDYAVQKAASLNIKLVMVLLNNFDGLGGINTYVNAFGGTPQTFYTNTAAQTAYQNYIKFIVKRYQNSGAVFSWELCNEPRCSGCPTSTITNWATTTSKFIKSIDSTHMVSVGSEGWLIPSSVPNDGSYPYQGGEGVDSVALLKIPTIDYGTAHLYPDQWGESYSWGSTWIQQQNTIGKNAYKPMILEEYAAPDANTRAQYVPQWQATIVQNTSIAGDMLWQFGSQFQNENPFDNYAVYYDTTAGSEFQTLVAPQIKAMAAKRT